MEILEESRASVESQPNDERSTAERRLALHLREIERRVVQLDTECEDWRRRALAAEAALEQRTAELEADRATLQRERALLQQAREQQAAEARQRSEPPRREPAAGAEAERPQPVRRPRGNWLR
jgi:hypothetical protein